MKTLATALFISLCTCSCCLTQRLLPEPGDVRPAFHPKKGACLITGKNNRDTWREKVASLNVSWHYSWGAALPEPEPAGVEFVPMIWGYWGSNDKFKNIISDLTVSASDDSAEYLLGFNEPDNKNQSNMPVARALEAWPYLMRTGRRLGSPGAVHAHKEWMQQFMEQAEAKNYRVDFVCVHWYGGPNAAGFLDYLKKVHRMYGKPIWITEFAVADWKAQTREENRYSPERVLRFMSKVLPELDRLEFVERYAWFSGSGNHKALGPSALFSEGGALTEPGRFYAAHALPRPRTDGGENHEPGGE